MSMRVCLIGGFGFQGRHVPDQFTIAGRVAGLAVPLAATFGNMDAIDP